MIGKDLLKKYKNTLISLISLALIILVSFLIYSHFSPQGVYSDEISEYYPSKVLISSGSLNLWNSKNDQYSTYYFKFIFSDEVIKNVGNSYPTQPPFVLLIVSIALSLFGDKAMFFISPVLSVLTLLFLYLTSTEIYKKNYSHLISILIVASFPLYITWSIFHQSTIFLTFFFAVSLFFLVRGVNTKIWSHFVFSYIFLILSVLIKPTSIILLPFFIMFYCLYLKPKNNKSLYIAILIISLVILLGLVLFNMKYFGGAFFLGQNRVYYTPISYNQSLVYEYSKDSVINYQISKIYNLTNIRDTILYFFSGVYKYSLLYLLIIIFSITFIPFVKCRRRYLLLFFIGSLFLIILYNSLIKEDLFMSWEKQQFGLSLSFFRYILPFMLVFPIFFVGSFFEKFKLDHKIKIILIFFLVLSFSHYLMYAYNYPEGGSISWNYNSYKYLYENYSEHLNNILKYNSTILYFDRYEMVFTYPHTIDYNWFYYDGIPAKYRLNETERVVNLMLNNNETVYIGIYKEPLLSTLLPKKDPEDITIKDFIDHIGEKFNLSIINETYFDDKKFYIATITKK